MSLGNPWKRHDDVLTSMWDVYIPRPSCSSSSSPHATILTFKGNVLDSWQSWEFLSRLQAMKRAIKDFNWA